jgi:hypothetical protein
MARRVVQTLASIAAAARRLVAVVGSVGVINDLRWRDLSG